MKNNQKTLVLFDFDGTITTHDSLIKFIRYSMGDIKTTLGFLSMTPMLLSYKLKLIPNYVAKQHMLSYFFKGMNEDRFKYLTREYSLNHVDKIVRPKAINKMQWHKEQGHTVVVISASIKCWLQPWCDKNELDIIATELEVVDNLLTGKFSTKNCYGIEKVNRVKKSYDIKQFEYIYAYGDSAGDKELLALAHESFYKPFRD